MNRGNVERSDKRFAVLDTALEMLKETGDAGLTMRKLAERSGMRLSNVQYYYKTRDDVLEALVAHYFDDCTQELEKLISESTETSTRSRAHLIILTGLRHGDELSDMCRIFRELWAISSRNLAIREHMAGYYRHFSALIADFILQGAGDTAVRDRMQSLLLPFLEGYSVTAASTPLSTEEVAEMLTDIAMAVAMPGYGPAPS